MSTKHWHDTPAFEKLVSERVDAMRSDTRSATNYCRHFTMMLGDGMLCLEAEAQTYFMHGRSGRTWLMCRECCRHNVEADLLTEPTGFQLN